MNKYMEEDNVDVNDIKIEQSKHNNESSKRNKVNYANVKDDREIDYDSNMDKNNQMNLEIIDNPQMEAQPPEKFQVPPHLKKTFICTMILAGLGLVLFILGFIQDVAAADPGKGITFWTLGGIVMIPGGYYAYQFYRAKKATNEDDRDNILNEIPEL
jgi:hypothetical protein